MARQKAAVNKTKPRKSRRMKPRNGEPAADMATLQTLRDTGKKDWMQSKSTRNSYDGYIRRGKDFLLELVGKQKASHPGGEGGIGVEDVDGEPVDYEQLQVAFDNPPNQYSALALELFLVEKCFNQNLGELTGNSTYSAFKKYWEMMANETYRGPYAYDKASDHVSGNPAMAARVQDLCRAIENKARSGGGSRNHAEAMTLENMTKLMMWSEQACPSEWTQQEITDLGTMQDVTKHLMMRAFMTSGFTIWTRNIELCSLQRKHYTPDCEGKAPYHIPHDLVKLENRKGWTRKSGGDGALVGNVYEIYEQKKTPEIDMYTHLRHWISFLETHLLNRRLGPEEFIFPTISVNGTVQTQKGIDHNVVQKYLNEFAMAVGLHVEYSTHCFRRGGAQYHFMFCPLGERWSLSTVRWWGGWAEGENVDTLIRYLLDELNTYETTHSDALHPLPRKADRSFMGDSPVTAAEIREFKMDVTREMTGLVVTMTDLSQRLRELQVQAAVASLDHVVGPQASSLAMTVLDHPNHPLINTLLQQVEPLMDHSQIVAHERTGMTTAPVQTGGTSTRTPVSAVLPHGGRPVPALRGVCIPDLPRPSRGSAWREAVKQWEEVDPTTGYTLKDWPQEWYTGVNRVSFAQKRTDRRMVALEYER
ncbi:hypothetical protein BKA93DRAFT_817719 [Sparassis latifolia]